MDDERLVAVAKALAHPARVHIVRLLSRQSECRGADVFSELPLAQSTVSQHLAVLREAGIVSSHPVGASHVYCLDVELLRLFGEQVCRLVDGSPECPATGGEC